MGGRSQRRSLLKSTQYNWQNLCVGFLCVLLLASCASSPTSAPNSPEADAATTTETARPTTTLDPQFANLPRLEGKATVEMVVKGRKILIELRGDVAPISAGNFADLVQRQVYDGLAFHRVVREPEPFVVQGGDPLSKDPNVPASSLGMGSYMDPETNFPRYIPLEIAPEEGEPIYGQTFQMAREPSLPKLTHTRGAVAMARSGDPNSASSQFYFALAELPFLDGNYAVFGYVTEGMEVVDQIQQGDRIESARIIAGAENLKTATGTDPASTSDAPTSAPTRDPASNPTGDTAESTEPETAPE